uniref:TAXi_C domain-containing protein n=1 Tax=Panagrellus redivivus TaxID=6233 RepID=A0A7E4VUR7_PANRE
MDAGMDDGRRRRCRCGQQRRHKKNRKEDESSVVEEEAAAGFRGARIYGVCLPINEVLIGDVPSSVSAVAVVDVGSFTVVFLKADDVVVDGIVASLYVASLPRREEGASLTPSIPRLTVVVCHGGGEMRLAWQLH